MHAVYSIIRCTRATKIYPLNLSHSQALYIAGIILITITLSNDEFDTWYTDQLTGDFDCSTGENKDAWWCSAIQDSKTSKSYLQFKLLFAGH